MTSTKNLAPPSGIGPVFAAVFLAEIGDVSRFATADKLTCWAGLTPRHRESDTTVHRGRVTKQGSKLVRWAAVEAVQRSTEPAVAAIRTRIAERRGRPGQRTGRNMPRSPPPGCCSSWSTTGCATARSGRWTAAQPHLASRTQHDRPLHPDRPGPPSWTRDRPSD
ncbi:MAG TPA: IS110 family transposase [Mycobacterium sp.]